MSKFLNDSHFRLFAKNVDSRIKDQKLDFSSKDFLKLQKQQVESLVALEAEFKDVLVNSSRGERIYKNFIHFIINDKKNLLIARPFFRERQRVFAAKVTPAIRNRRC